jgi:hypothetical protein
MTRTVTYFNFNFDGPFIDIRVIDLLESYLPEHSQLYLKGEPLEDFYKDVVDKMSLTFDYYHQSVDYDGEALTSHLEVSDNIFNLRLHTDEGMVVAC